MTWNVYQIGFVLTSYLKMFKKTQFVVFWTPNTTQRNMISIKIGTENIQRVKSC